MPDNLQDIIKKIKGGDKASFRLLINRFQHKAYGLAFRILGDEEAAKDVVQESFIRIWENIHHYKPNEKFTNWMYKIISNRSIDQIRSKRRKTMQSFDDNLTVKVLESDHLNDVKLEYKELGQIIGLLSGSLPERQRLVFSLRDLEGLNVEETMAITGQTASQIKSNLHHARKAIREKLNVILNFESKIK